VHISPPVLPACPPSMSPKQTSFSPPDESHSSVLSPRHPPALSNSNPIVEIATKLSEPVDMSSQTIIPENRPSSSMNREISNGQTKKPYDEDEVAWDPAPSSSAIRNADDSERISPATSRGTRPQPATASASHFRSAPSYNSRRPVPPPISGLQDTRNPQQRTGRQQPLPFSYVAYWKGEEVVNKKPSLGTKSFSLGRSVMKPKSMDNLKLTSPTSASNWRNSPPALPTRPSGHIGYSPSSNLSGTPKSYEPPRGNSFARPLPAQGSPLPTSSEFGPTSSGDQTSRFPSNVTSPTQDPFPRPSSALGDSNTSPTNVYPKVTSPGYGSMLDPGDNHRSPRAVSPHRGFQLSGGIHGPRSRPNNYSDPSDRSSDIQSGPETSTSTPPRTPISPQSPRYEQKRIVFDSSLSSPVDSPSDSKPSETITYDTRDRLVESIKQDETLRPPPAASLPQSDSKSAYGADGDDDDESDNGGGTWIVPPGAKPKTPRPQLNVQIEDHSPLTSTRASNRSELTQNTTLFRRDALSSKQPQRRPQSIFVDDDDDSWAPRPPPENIYDHLEKFFPTHDLDKPVIDTTPGDTSPVSTETAAALPPPMPVNDEKSKMRSKKSIRIVVQDFKKKYDNRTSKADTSYDKNMLRKRNTKLWGSRLEEVTTVHSRSMTSSPDSPSGGPSKAFFFMHILKLDYFS
jgi:mitogen-activated protein kinase kinase kinase